MRLLHAVVALGVLVFSGHALKEKHHALMVDMDPVHTTTITFRPQSEDAILSFVMAKPSDKRTAMVKNIIGHKNGKLCVLTFGTGNIASQIKSKLLDGDISTMTADDLENRRHILSVPNAASIMQKYGWAPRPTSFTTLNQLTRLVDACKDSAGDMKWDGLNKDYKISVVNKNNTWQLELNGQIAEGVDDAVGFPIARTPGFRSPLTIAVRSGIALEEIKVGLSENNKGADASAVTVNKQIKAELSYGFNLTVSFTPVKKDGILSIVMHHPRSESYAVTYDFVGNKAGKLCVAYYWSPKPKVSVTTSFNTRPWNLTHEEKYKRDLMKHPWSDTINNPIPKSPFKLVNGGRLGGFLDGCHQSGEISWETIGKEYKVTVTSEDNKFVFRLVGDSSNQLDVFTLPVSPDKFYDFIFAADKGMSLGDVVIDPAD